jgi:hypothetical protein
MQALFHSLHLPPPWRFIPFAVFVALVWLRLPVPMHDGRFWAEEGTLYFTHAWTLPWVPALLKSSNGYLSLAANFGGLLARYAVPLEDAPHVTAMFALSLQALPALLLTIARDSWLRRPIVLIAAMLLLAMPPVCDEVWLNLANSQFHLALAAALCLVLETPCGAYGIPRNVLLFLTPLSSPASIALIPLFVARAVWDRQKSRALQAGCIVSGAVMQLMVFYHSLAERGHLLGPATLASVFVVKHLAIPFLGEEEANFIAADVHGDVIAGHYPVLAMLAAFVAVSALGLAIALRRRPEPVWLLLAAGTVAYLSYNAALGGGPSLITAVGVNRYAFVPCMLTALALLSVAATAADRLSQITWATIGWLLVISVQQTLLPQDEVFVDGPDWKTEIAKWRADPKHPIAIWPTGWVMHLPPHAR